ncbi:MAG: hypothetical protein ACLQMF_09310 [Rectinemataceae bacterium]
MNIRRFLILGFVLLSACGVAAAEPAPSLEKYLAGQFPDNSDVRARLFSSVIGAPRELAETFGERALKSRAGVVTVRTVKGDDDFFVEFLNGAGASFTQGSCIIKRSNARGYLVQAKIYLQDDPGCYLRLYRGGDGTRMDVIMYGAVVKKGLYLSGLLYTVLTSRFSDIVDATSSSFDWNTVFELGAREPSAAFAASLRGAIASAQPSAGEGGAGASDRKADTGNVPTVALASASPVSGMSRAKSMVVGRAYKIAIAVDAASNADALVAELGAAGESPQELRAGSGDPVEFDDDRGGPDVSLPYDRFPDYEPGKGLPLSALRAAIYLDDLANPDSIYAVLGGKLRFTVAPTYDEVGRLDFAFFSKDRELDWTDISRQSGDALLRVIRLRASRG